jgi:kynureninase
VSGGPREIRPRQIDSRSAALDADATDPLGGFPDRFVVADPSLCYLDGNSLGRLPRGAAERVADTITREWGGELVEAWEGWIDLPVRLGDRLATGVLGAPPGSTVVADSTSVNLYKLLGAALDARPDRHVLLVDDDNFPSDRYVAEGLARQRGLVVREVAVDPVSGMDPDMLEGALTDDVAVATFSHVSYRSAALVDLAGVNRRAERVGALVVWDLSHSAGAVPVDVMATATRLAVGCTYKYLCGGPGAPAFLYVDGALAGSLTPSLRGWWGQRDQFAMGAHYEPADGIARFLVGTPPVLALAAAEVGVDLVAEAGIGALRAKGMAVTSMIVGFADAHLASLGFTLASPRDPARRGAHVSLAHPEARRISTALRTRAGVVADFRAPDRLRLGPAPLSTRYAELWDGLERLQALVASGGHLDVDASARVS